MRLVLDWDGTCTVSDSLVDAVQAFGDPSVYERRFASIDDSLEAEVGTIRATAGEAAAWAVEHVRLRPGFHRLVERFPPMIVSSGLRQLIDPVLGREGVEVDLQCNDADPRPDGWRLRFRDDSRCPVCDDRFKRSALPDDGPLVYAGDGISDRCAARAADRIFARGWLAENLERSGIRYEPFESLDDIAAALS